MTAIAEQLAPAPTPAPAAPNHSASPRIDYRQVAPGAIQAQYALESYIRGSGIESSLLHLMKLRASYINGCAYCVDMHTKDARAEGETEQRLYATAVWKETPFFTPRERAALAWTDELTNIAETGASDEAFEAVRAHFTDDEVVKLTMIVVTINGWNRIAIGLRAPVGSYEAKK